MYTRTRRRMFSAGLRVAALVAVVAGVVGGAPLRAEAATYPTWGSTASEVGTWLDSAGRVQSTWVSHLSTQAQPNKWELLTIRQTLAGQADATWGTDPFTGAAGVRRTAIDPPTGTTIDYVAALSTDASGNSTVAWMTLPFQANGEGCDDDVNASEVVLDRYTPTGARSSRNAVSHYQYTGCTAPSHFVYATTVVPLTDGSVAVQELTEDANTPTSSKILWYGGAGDTKASFAISVADPTFDAVGLTAASTNGDGRLYVTTTDGLLRRASSAGVDRSIPSTCRYGQPSQGPLLPVAGPGGSFAAVCGSGDYPSTGNRGLQVRRYDAGGALTSTVTSLTSASNIEVSQPTTGAFDSTGRLWVGGPACTYDNGAVHCYRTGGLDTGAVSAFDTTHKVDGLSTEANQVDGMRSVGNGRVTFGMPGTAYNGADRVSIFALPTPPAPVAKAGADLTVGSGQTFTLDGSTSTGDTPAYQWVQIAGPATTIQNPQSAKATVTGRAGPATLTYRLTVTDGSGRTSTDDVTVTVSAPK